MITTLTGHPKVDALAQIRFEGDITPKSWYKHICYQTKKGEAKADRLAIDILSDIVYWYRPYQKRDELTGESIGWKKRFTEDLLRRSPDAFAETLNASVRCVRESMKLLEHMGLITVVLKPIKTAYGVIPNVMHIDINPDAIASITYRSNFQEPPETLEKSLLTKWVTSNDEMGNKQRRNRHQVTTKSSPTNDEICNSSIYRDLTEISVETSSETSPLSPQGEKSECEAVAVVVEVLPEEDSSEQSDRTHESQEQLASLTKFNSSEGQDSGRARCNNKALQKLIERFENGQITKLPPHELKMLADAVIGDYVAEYRQSGNINSANPNDIRPEFLAYVTSNHLSSKLRNSVNAFGRIRNIEQEPTQWRSLVEMVEGWLARRRGSTFDERNQTPAQKTAEFEDFMAELLSADA